MRITAIFTAAAIALAASPALAAGPDLPVTAKVTVRLGDLDLNSPRGAHAAMARLTRAAGEACGDQTGVTPALIWLSDAFRRCRATTLEAAVAQIHTPAAAAAFDEVRGRTVRLAKR